MRWVDVGVWWSIDMCLLFIWIIIYDHRWRLDVLSGCGCVICVYFSYKSSSMKVRCGCVMECENPSSSDSVPLWPVLSCCESPVLFIFYISILYFCRVLYSFFSTASGALGEVPFSDIYIYIYSSSIYRSGDSFESSVAFLNSPAQPSPKLP